MLSFMEICESDTWCQILEGGGNLEAIMSFEYLTAVGHPHGSILALSWQHPV
jgi:hypothetical protein